MLKLWENGTPYFNADYNQEEPSLTPFIVKNNGDKKAGCVIVLPGGAYAMRAEHEGAPVSLMLNHAGINSFVLSYRVAPYRHPVMLTDVTRAVKYVRYHSGDWNIDPEKIAVLGFSAGGHLTVTAIEHFDYGNNNGDEIDKVSSRPNAGILCYPVVTFGAMTNGGTLYNLLGENPDPQLRISLSGENSVRNDTPPVFIWHTADDECVPVENSLDLASALRKKNVPFELHVFPHGKHGLGLAPNTPDVAQWSELLINWLSRQGYTAF